MTRVQYVITEHMEHMGMPSSVLSLYDTKEDAVKEVEALIVEYNAEYKEDEPESPHLIYPSRGPMVWIYTPQQDSYIRVKKSITKDHSFSEIRNDSALHEYRFDITPLVTNKSSRRTAAKK